MAEKKKDYIISGKTSCGIHFSIDSRVKQDSRFLHYLVKMRDKSDRIAQASAMFSLLDMLFGGDEGVMVFENEIAKRNEGICTEKELVAQLQEIFEAMNLKNS